MSKLYRTVSKSVPGKTDLTCSSGTSVKKTTVAVCKADLIFAGVSETNEETIGGLVVVNEDDDNTNGVADKADAGPVAGEDDLKALSIVFQPLDIGTGTLTLAATSGGSKIRLWSDAGKSNGPISLPKQWNLAGIASNPIPSALYVEGFNVSDSARDVGLRLVYEAGGFSVEDKVKLTVVKVEIENTAPRDTDDIQVQYFTNNAGVFTYTAIPLQIYYRLQPDSGWTPDSVQLRIKDSAGSVVRTVTLSTSVGQQQITWDGRSDAGDFPPFGSNYIVEITASVGAITCTATNKLGIYELRQGNCVYRPLTVPINEHAAILYEYQGGNRLSELQTYANYTVMEISGPGATPEPSNFGTYNNWIGFYSPHAQTRVQRQAILQEAHTLDNTTIPYVPAFPLPGFFNCLIYNDTTNSPAGTDWAGVIADIANLRCDGFVEVTYEDTGVRLYGGDDWWNIMAPGAGSGSNLERHNNGSDSINPQRQRQGIDGFGTLTENRFNSAYPFMPQP